MAALTYRDYRPEDADQVTAIIGEAFSFDRHIRSPRLLDSVLEAYLLGSLLTSSYAKVAVEQGRVVGILTGRVEGQPRLPGAPADQLRVARHLLTIAAFGLPEARALGQYLTLSRIYRTLRQDAAADLADELTLFAVSSSARGLGVGRHLFDGFLQHLRAHGRADFYLYTDSQSSYGFYDKRGMSRSAQQAMTISRDGRPEELEVYLYTGTSAALASQ